MKQSVGVNIARNSLSSMGGQIALKLLSFAYSVAVVRQLGSDLYGYYVTAIALVEILAVFADLGMANYVVREIAKDRSRVAALYGNMVALRVLLGAGVFVCNVLLAWAIGYDPGMIGYVALGSLGLLLYSVRGPLTSVLQGFERIDQTVRLNVLNQVVVIAVGGVLLWLGLGVIGVFIASFVAIVVTTVSAWRMTRRLTELPLRIQLHSWPTLVRAGIPFALTTFATMLSFRMDTVLLSLWNSAQEVAWYNIAYNLIFALLALSSSFNSALVPSLTRQYKLDPEAVGRFYANTVKLLWIAAVPIAIGTTFLAERLVVLIYGAEYAPAGFVLQILIWVLPVLMITAFCGSMTTVFHREVSTARINLINAAFNIGLNLWAIPRYGLAGAAVTTVITEVLCLVQYMVLLRDVIPLRKALTTFLAPVLPVLLMIGGILLTFNLHVLLIIPVAASIYVAALFFVRSVQVAEVQAILHAVTGAVVQRRSAVTK